MNPFKSFIIGSWLATAGILSAQSVPVPTAPSNLRVTVLGMNAFLMEWKDNSSNEKGWEIRVSLGKTSTPNRFQFLNTPNATSYVVLTNDLPNREFSFQVAAFAGDTGSEVFSAPSSAITVKSLGSSSFDAPVNLKATAIDDGRCRLSWTDRTTSEYGYQIQFKKGNKGKWEDLV
ncbi:MAG: fibronectin type III domain-containing protein, partial [Akkermansiaceae bacterium]|nr:fibronectin type III domain-containing protein [Akkermansiaceae bacterium]